PLLDLYRQSDLVAIAQIGQSTIVETEDGSKRLKTTLRISSQFKGENNQQVIPLYFWDDDIYPLKLKPGDGLLVLLQHPSRKKESSWTVLNRPTEITPLKNWMMPRWPSIANASRS